MPIPTLIIAALTPIALIATGMAAIPLLALLTLALLAKERRIGAGRTSLTVIGLLVAWPLFTFWHSYTPEVSMESGLRTLAIMLLGAGAMWLAGRSGIHARAAKALAVSLLIVSLFVVQEPLLGLLEHFMEPYDYARYMVKNMNRGLCALTVLTWPAALGLLSIGKRRAGLLLPLAVLPAVLTMHSLSAKMGFVLGGFVFYALLWKPQPLSRALCVIVPLLLAAWPIGFTLLDAPVRENANVFDAMPESSQHRWLIWGFAMERIHDRPVAGWGMDTARAMPGGNDPFDAKGKRLMPLHTHNSIFQLVLEEGVIGFILTLGALVVLLRAWNRLPGGEQDLRAASGAAIVAYVSVGMTAFGIWQGWWIASAWLAGALLMLHGRNSSAKP